MSIRLNDIPFLIRGAVEGKITEFDISLLVKSAHNLAVIRLNQLKLAGKLFIDALPYSIELTAMDCIAEIFERDEEGRFVILMEYFSGQRDLKTLDEKQIIYNFSILIHSKLNDGIYRLYSENDPILNNILRNLKRVITLDAKYKKYSRFGRTYIYTCPSDERNDHQPEIPINELESLILNEYYSGKNKKECKNFLELVFNLINDNTEYRRFFCLIDLAVLFKSLFTRKKVPIEEIVFVPEEMIISNIPVIIEKKINELEVILKIRYLKTNKLDEVEFLNYFSAVSDILYDIYNEDGDDSRYYEYLQKYLPDLKYEDYRKNHRSQFEYMVRISKKFVNQYFKQLL
jgi:hypothetical protein